MPPMHLQYDADLPYQRAAIDAALGLFDGQPLADSAQSVSFNLGPLQITEHGLGNRLALDDSSLLANLQRVQEQNNIPKAAALAGRDFAVEMETGTGKTYVFLRTAFELNQTYGFSKFVVVVPSVAIREGVLHSIQTMRDHFRALYSIPFDHFVYDSKQLGRLRSFATSNAMQLMVINIQAFQRDIKGADDDPAPGPSTANVIYREQDRLSGQRPIDFLRDTHPVVIIDEPQSTASGAASAAAIARLNPLCTLRYSATYDSPQKIYKLGPIEALDQKLVKRIEVASVREDANYNDAFVRLLKVDAKKQNAQIQVNGGGGALVAQKKLTVKRHHDLAVQTGRLEYRDGFVVETISFETGNEYLEFANGRRVAPGPALGGLDDEVMRAQVRETVREHLDKEKRLRSRGVKILSLFFVDKVENYRRYNDDNTWTLGKIGQWFEEAFTEISTRADFQGLIPDPIERIHNGYFSADKKGAYRNTSGKTADDDDTYALIMRDKEKLLSFDEPLRFIFSHSALREGWDNPNVFQICTLNESRSPTRKRQEIGRGLRLPVDQQGERVRDDAVNRLTVVANESYKTFAEQLQTEYEQDAGVQFGRVPDIAFADLTIQVGLDLGPDAVAPALPPPLGQDASRALWNHLRRAGYLDHDGKILDRFDPKHPAFTLDVPTGYEGARAPITDAINRYVFATRVVDARRRQEVRVRKQVLDDGNFRRLWNTVAQRTRYRVSLDTEQLVVEAAERIRLQPPIQPPRIEIETRAVDVTRAGVAAGAIRRQSDEEVQRAFEVPDVLAYLQNETELTRRTLARILVESGRSGDLLVNPQALITIAAREINLALQDQLLRGIQYHRVDGRVWEMHRLEDDAEQALGAYLDNLYRVRNQEKTPVDYVEFQSKVEEEFARALDENEAVKLFLKLPPWFTVDTPLGPYNPDWAILYQGDTTTLSLVRETKGSPDTAALRATEANKIVCGRKHFAAIGVDYDVTTSLPDALRQARYRTPSPTAQTSG